MVCPSKKSNLSYLKETVEKYYTVFTFKAFGMEAFKDKNKDVCACVYVCVCVCVSGKPFS